MHTFRNVLHVLSDIINVPRQCCNVQALVSVTLIPHKRPSVGSVGYVQRLDRCLCPLPHVTEHVDHRFQLIHIPLAKTITTDW